MWYILYTRHFIGLCNIYILFHYFILCKLGAYLPDNVQNEILNDKSLSLQRNENRMKIVGTSM